jgi:hypothetical protein
LCHSPGSEYEKPKKSFLYVFWTKVPLSGLGVVSLLVDCWQLTRDVAAQSSTSKDSLFMAVQLTRVEQAWRPAMSTGKPPDKSGDGPRGTMSHFSGYRVYQALTVEPISTHDSAQ